MDIIRCHVDCTAEKCVAQNVTRKDCKKCTQKPDSQEIFDDCIHFHNGDCTKRPPPQPSERLLFPWQ